MKTIDALGICWTFDTKRPDGTVSRGQDEVSGLILYGFWALRRGAPDTASLRARLAEQATVQTRMRSWETERGSLFSVEVLVERWPQSSQWAAWLERALGWFLEQGALVSWCGGEDSSPSPDVFDPARGAGEVYAAACKALGFVCNAGLVDEYQVLSTEQRRSFRHVLQAARGS